MKKIIKATVLSFIAVSTLASLQGEYKLISNDTDSSRCPNYAQLTIDKAADQAVFAREGLTQCSAYDQACATFKKLNGKTYKEKSKNSSHGTTFKKTGKTTLTSTLLTNTEVISEVNFFITTSKYQITKTLAAKGDQLSYTIEFKNIWGEKDWNVSCLYEKN